MTKEKPKNMAASVRQRLLNLARERQEDFQLVLSRYSLERLLYRIDQSAYRGNFVVKGAMLFHLWMGQLCRSTRDIDFLAYGNPTVTNLETIFKKVCAQNVEDDGLILKADSVAGTVIKPDQEYQGVRIRLLATLERVRIPVQIDIGFGDAITPEPQEIEYPSLLGFPTPNVATYPRETVVAEKFQAIVMLGMANSRMKDFFDLWVLSENFEFEGNLLARAIQATFERRRTALPEGLPTAFTAEFYDNDSKQKQWNAFVTNAGLRQVISFSEQIEQLKTFLLPPVHSIRLGEPFRQRWIPPGTWQA